MTTHAPRLILDTEPKRRTTRLIWGALALATVAVATLLIVLMTGGTQHATTQAPPRGGTDGGGKGQVATVHCVPTQVVHIC
ncbi:MAG: hypothetical protein ACRDVG_08970 [Jatrophihabitantaceae bacterium]